MSSRTVSVGRDIRAEQQAAAEAFRQQRSRQGTLVVRLLSAPGSGKTTLLEHTLPLLSNRYATAVLVGDVETERDAQRLQPFAPTVQITTGGACHLEIPLVETAFAKLDNQQPDFLFIEDIGNLICPASHDVGEHLRVIVLSTTEGDDKPGKYPKAFRTSQVAVITKTDLLPYVPFSIERVEVDARRVHPELEFVTVCAITGHGMAKWCDLLIEAHDKLLTQLPSSTSPAVPPH